MKLTCDYFDGVIEIEEGIPFVLVLEKPELFLKFVKDIYMQTTGKDGEIVFSENGILIKPSKKVELISTFVPFDINEKRLLNKLNGLIEKEALNEDNYERTMKLMAEIERFVDDVAGFFGFSLNYTGVSVNSLLKMCGAEIEDDSNSEIERVLNYMSIVCDLLGEKLFVFVNMRTFFSEQEMNEFTKMVALRKYYVLQLEN